MKIFNKLTIPVEVLQGRSIQKAIGKDALSISKKITMGFARYSPELGPMEPHQHAEEVMYILDAELAWVRWGNHRESLKSKMTLEKGMVLHIPELEWHVFECEKDGYIEAIFFYGQVDNIRPEEIRKI